MTLKKRCIRGFAIAGAVLTSAFTAIAGALMASGYTHLGGLEVFNSSGMIPAWLFTKGDNFTSDAEHALYAIPFSLVLNVGIGAALGAVIGILACPTCRGHQANKLR